MAADLSNEEKLEKAKQLINEVNELKISEEDLGMISGGADKGANHFCAFDGTDLICWPPSK